MVQITQSSEFHEQPSERRRHSHSEKDSEKTHKSRRSKSKINNSEPGSYTKSRHKIKEGVENEKLRKRVSEPVLTMEDLVPELSRASSRNSVPYPSFNKAHSKESVRTTKDNIRMTIAGIEKPPLTPVMTDLDWEKKLGSKTDEQSHMKSKGERPPSPPETDIDPQKVFLHRRMSDLHEYTEEEKGNEEQENEEESDINSSVKSPLGSKLSKNESKSKSSITGESSNPSPLRQNKGRVTNERKISTPISTNTSPDDSDNAKISPKRVGSSIESSNVSASPTTKSSSDSPQITTQSEKTILSPSKLQTSSSLTQHETQDEISNAQIPIKPYSISQSKVSDYIPRINYLLQNGGLHRPVPKKIVSSSPNPAPPHLFTPSPIKIDEIFGPCLNLLDKYEAVLEKQGSLAVATGYRSVARRLLDRLEVVMGRVLSSDGCLCLMCHHPELATGKKPRGLGWGEVLEWSAGRKELPSWPVFDFGTLGVEALNELDVLGKAQQDTARPRSPIKIDPDIADEFRQYYLQQSKKTKLAVNKWLSSCTPLAAPAPPQEVDDETLSFSILTHLPKDDRPVFNALVTGSSKLQPSILAPVFLNKPRSELISKTALSLQRLYRLPISPRVPEAAIFLLRYPDLHDLMATVSQISSHEWEILTSGRFDGFLWSGADPDVSYVPPLPCQGTASRSKSLNGKRKPFENPQFTNGTSCPSRMPVLNDEETEIAVLAEIDREIYLGMETLEDAFEALHRKAELVRRGLRERGASLTLSLQSRRLMQPTIIDGEELEPLKSGLGPGYERPGWTDNSDTPCDSDWDYGDNFSELAPDDSASNIGSSKFRRPKHRDGIRAPVLIEEEDEG